MSQMMYSPYHVLQTGGIQPVQYMPVEYSPLNNFQFNPFNQCIQIQQGQCISSSFPRDSFQTDPILPTQEIPMVTQAINATVTRQPRQSFEQRPQCNRQEHRRRRKQKASEEVIEISDEKKEKNEFELHIDEIFKNYENTNIFKNSICFLPISVVLYRYRLYFCFWQLSAL